MQMANPLGAHLLEVSAADAAHAFLMSPLLVTAFDPAQHRGGLSASPWNIPDRRRTHVVNTEDKCDE